MTILDIENSEEAEKKQPRKSKKEWVLDSLEESVSFVKLYQRGNVEMKTIQQLLDEL